MSSKDDTWEMLEYFKNTKSQPLVEKQLETSISSNIANTELARETLKHFKESKLNNRIALYSTLFVSVITCTILIVQTVSVQRTELTQPVKLESQEIRELLQETKANNLLLIQQVDSVKSEFRRLYNTTHAKLNNGNK